MAQAWTVHLLHIYHEAKECGDALVKRGHQQQSILEVYNTHSSFVYTAFVWDMKHLKTSRLYPLEVFKPVVV